MHTTQQPSSTVSKVWNQWQQARNLNPSQYVDWGDHPTILALLYGEMFGSPSTSIFDYLKQAYPNFVNSSVLSLCAGDGAFEKLLLKQGVFGTITGIDLAEERVGTANAQIAEFEGRLNFIVGDVNKGDFGVALYDVVFAKAALHHVEQLESMFAGIKKCLKPGGKLVTVDFFGPTRFQWSDAQLDAVNHFIDTAIPDTLLKRADGSRHHNINRPTIEAMIAMDPSEAVRSSDIDHLIRQHFSQIREFQIGGALLSLIFDPTVVNNFDCSNPQHNEIIHAAFHYERRLMAENKIGSDFKFIVAQA
ncbi:MAG: class I SAM-dependent methyltransferase [Gallionellaceae bacterium]|nr:class I SAM-dependent methyltransferase [Gallionellaceae bacterium]